MELRSILDIIDHIMYKEKSKEVNRGKDNDIIKIIFDNKGVGNDQSRENTTTEGSVE